MSRYIRRTQPARGYILEHHIKVTFLTFWLPVSGKNFPLCAENRSSRHLSTLLAMSYERHNAAMTRQIKSLVLCSHSVQYEREDDAWNYIDVPHART